MRKLLIITIIVLFSSCRTYIDGGKNIQSDYIDFNYFPDHNEFVYKSKINAISDKQIYYTTNFIINLPKKIINWQTSNNEFYFEYEDKEIIYVNSGYRNIGDAGNWILRETDDKEIFEKLSFYWDDKKYDENDLKVSQFGKISKVYTDGKFTVLLYNIKEKNYFKYLELIRKVVYQGNVSD